MEFVQKNDKILFVWDGSFNLEASEFSVDNVKSTHDAVISFEHVERLSLASHGNASFTLVVLRLSEPKDIQFYAALLKLLKPKGRIVHPGQQAETVLENLKLTGFVNAAAAGNDIVAEKPNYEIGSSAKLSFAKKPAVSAWKIDDDDDNDLIDADDLLDEEDKAKPDPSQLRVCGTTGKRKACKDCSCGLAEELDGEKKASAPASENAKSSCGSCYLGDAFRCASCPYLGMPAFKPGQKVQLAGGLLKDDI